MVLRVELHIYFVDLISFSWQLEWSDVELEANLGHISSNTAEK